MNENRDHFTDLLLSVSGVMIFLSLAYFIDLNGFTEYSIILFLLGVTMTFSPDMFLKLFKPLKVITKSMVITISHILIFIGLKNLFLDQFLDQFWPLFFILGALILNYKQQIARWMYRHR